MDQHLPEDPVHFIRRCITERKLFWTYHVNMRLEKRHIAREEILEAAAEYVLVESYPHDKYLPSYLVGAVNRFHVLFAVDLPGDNVRVVTAYRPDPEEWEPPELLRRRKS